MYGHGHKMHGHGHKMYGGSHSDMEGGAFADGSDMGVTGVGLVVRVLVNRQAMPIVRRHTAHGEPVSSDYHNKNLQISSGGAAARAGLIDRSRARRRGI
jgi:hypothetical protein